MDSSVLRRRRELVESLGYLEVDGSDTASNNHEVPKYTIDLSLPPVLRYQQVAADFKAQTAALPALFDEIVLGMNVNARVDRVRRIARLFLRRVFYKEETEELRGISQVTGIEMWLLVAFNVLLDLFMGCTSGAAKVDDGQGGKKMLHFRTLDWGMDPLRKVVVQLDFIQKPGGNVIASSITYVGYVGVLTGVRKGLSMSLNFRPNHDTSTRLANFRFYFHHLLVLLGFRPSISSILRQHLLPSQPSSGHSEATIPSLASTKRFLPGIATTAAYLIFTNGTRTITMEKDHHKATVKSSREFIVSTNHDATEERNPESKAEHEQDPASTLQATGMQDLVEDSVERKDFAKHLWQESLRRTRRTGPRPPLTKDTIVGWINTYPIANEETHYAVIMDPKVGEVAWVERYLEPLECS